MKVAIIPAKSISSRISNKNFRDFYNGKSLLEIKIEQCLESNVFDEIYLSSDDPQCQYFSEKYGIEYIKRDIKYCIDETPWSEVLLSILEQTKTSDSDLIAWVPVTTPLFFKYKEAFELLESSLESDSLMTVTELKHYMLNSDYIPCNFQFGVWASYSQNIKPYYQMNCALWIAPKGKMKQNRFQTGDFPCFMKTSQLDSVDIDVMEEFELAQILFEKKNGNKSY